MLERHATYLTRLADDGVLILAGRTQTSGPETRSLAIFLADDEAAARAIMAADPAVSNGVMTATLQPYKVAFGNVKALWRALAD